MKTLRFVLILVLVSLPVFYLGAILISGEADVTKMNGNVRAPVFGGWLAFVVIAFTVYCLDKNAPK
jgi:hypothetical protein